MNVTLISYTPDALNLLIFTRSTRLKMTPSSYHEVANWPYEKKLKELDHMRNTIASSWEFVDYVFSIEHVTRAFTHQLVRHRVGTSFAQQSQRTVDMEGFGYVTGPSIQKDLGAVTAYVEAMRFIDEAYQQLIQIGVPPEDARGLLPTNIATNIIFKANLRTLSEMALKRLCAKTQGEFQQVMIRMREAILAVHPWAEPFIRVWCAREGTCCFPDHPVEKCPIKEYVYDPVMGHAYKKEHEPTKPASSKEVIQAAWSASIGRKSDG